MLTVILSFILFFEKCIAIPIAIGTDDLIRLDDCSLIPTASWATGIPTAQEGTSPNLPDGRQVVHYQRTTSNKLFICFNLRHSENTTENVLSFIAEGIVSIPRVTHIQRLH